LGLHLRFIDPVKLDIRKRRFAPHEEVIIHWESYSGATSYAVQVYEKTEPYGFDGTVTMFPWSKRPVVQEPFVNLNGLVELKPGHYYTISVNALGKNSEAISNTGNRLSWFDFEIAE
jgi:hypothetical protein